MFTMSRILVCGVATHGSDSQVVLVTTHAQIADDVERSLNAQIEQLSRKHFAKDALTNSHVLIVSTQQEAADFINYYAPEHYIIASENPEYMLNAVVNAGSVFIGNFTPESAGDYASGTNHTLPHQWFCPTVQWS